jgi:hypothetical protein
LCRIYIGSGGALEWLLRESVIIETVRQGPRSFSFFHEPC